MTSKKEVSNRKEMSSKRVQLGFDDLDSVDESYFIQNHQKKKLKLPKLTFSKVDELEKDNQETNYEKEQSDTRPVLGKPSGTIDNDDDYMNMIIKEDELTAPQRLRSKDDSTLTSNSYENIGEKRNKVLGTSLFGKVENSEEYEDNVMKPLPNNQLKTKSKGLSIMEKMGFKIGETLGQDSQKGNALLEPLITVQKTSRSGIKETLTEDVGGKSEGITKQDEFEFRNRLNKENNDTRLEKIVHKMQKYCYQFSGDADNDIAKQNPLDINVLWRGYVIYIQQQVLKSKKETKNDDQVDTTEQLQEKDQENEDGTDEELNIFDQLPWSKKVERLNLQLRSQYDYCFFCGAKYEGQQDLFENCPGPNEEDHL